jgi:hypothetical protein
MSNEHRFKVGDHVAIIFLAGWSRRKYMRWRGVVDAVHKTGHVIAAGKKFRQNGSAVGGAPYNTSELLRPWTPELAAELAEAKAMDAAEKLCFQLADALRKARGEDAVRLAGMIPDEMKRIAQEAAE